MLENVYKLNIKLSDMQNIDVIILYDLCLYGCMRKNLKSYKTLSPNSSQAIGPMRLNMFTTL